MQCKSCGQNFEYFSGEKEAYEKFKLQSPLVCQACRHKRRLIFRNEKNLFYNKSFLSGKKILSLYPQSSPFKIIDQNEWWSDDFDATKYGRDYDFNKPFFQQFRDLQKDVPRWSRIVVNCENSEFANNCAQVKNCFLTFSSYESEDLLYCMRVFKSNNCVDCLNVIEGQFCSQCSDCKKCYNLHYSVLSENCIDSFYLFDCRNCKNCIMSSGMRNKEYYVFNKQVSPEDYKKEKSKFLSEMNLNKDHYDEMFNKNILQTPHKNLNLINAQNCTGNFINDSKNIINGFYTINCEDCINIYDSTQLKDCYDNSYNEKSQFCIVIDTCYELYESKFCTYCITLSQSEYCDQSDHLQQCFGCIGLKRHKNMILNKQYSAEEYKKMIEKIEAHMRSTGEYGHPFPSNLTPFPYNATLAFEHYPLNKKQAVELGYMWHDEEDNQLSSAADLETLISKKSGKSYKIIPQEAKFYKKLQLPIPKITPHERYKELMAKQPPKKLIDTKCSLCGKEIKTVYSQKENFKIICEDCYSKTVY